MKKNILAKIALMSLTSVCLLTQHAYAFKIISFKGVPAYWHKTGIQIEMDPDFGSAFNSKGCDSNFVGKCVTPVDAIRQSVTTWKKVSGVSIDTNDVKPKIITGIPNYDGKNQIKFFKDQWETLPFAPPTSALAVTISTYGEHSEIEDADIFINGKYFDWAVVDTSNENNKHDIQNVITHEMGHFFGLDHSSQNPNETNIDLASATMFYASYIGETSRRTLEDDDITGIKHLYTTDEVDEPSISNISPSSVQVSYKGSITLEITGDNFLPMTTVVLARNTDSGDVIGRTLSVEGSKITASFDVSDMQSGQYNVVVANSFNKFVQVDKGFSIENSTVPGVYNADQANSNGQMGGCRSSGSSSLLFFLLPILFILPRRIRQQA